ncbi:hypothetical protein ACP275_01G076500 [Erythranthe tilingii]
MSQKVDKTGQRTLAVVTKADKSPEGLLEKVTADDVSIGLGYVCVRNRIGDESYEEARAEEAKLFDTHCLLSKIEKSMVGIPVLAERLVRIQANIIVKCLPEIVRKVNEKLAANIEELNKLPKHLTSVGEAMAAFMHIVCSAKESLRKILIQDEDIDESENFLVDEIRVLKESKAIGLPNFIPKSAFYTLLEKNVSAISKIPVRFVEKIWSYVENVVVSVLLKHSENYPQLASSTRRAAQKLVAKMKQQSVDWVNDVVEMEKLTDYTCTNGYIDSWDDLMSNRDQFMAAVDGSSNSSTVVEIEDFGEVDVAHLRDVLSGVGEAFDLKMRMTAYWGVVLERMELVGPQGNGFDRMMEESPLVAGKRNKLRKSIKLLNESKDVVADIIDKISDNFD